MKPEERASLIRRLQGLPGVVVEEYPLFEVSLFLAGDEEYLRAAIFGCHLRDRRLMEDDLARGSAMSIRAAIRFLDAYFRHETAPLPPMDLSTFTEKERRVYAALLAVPAGAVVSYGDLAAASGLPRAARFAGTTMARNLFPIFIPCHRVVRSDGSPGNYGGGPEMKRRLLDYEAGRA